MIDEERAAEQKELGLSKPWLDLIGESDKAFNTYDDKCTNIEKQYASLKDMAEAKGERELQIFWANLEVLRPTIYQRPPQPVVMPRHSDTGEVVRKASELIERVLEVDVELDDLHDTLILVRDDLAICARGVAWVLDNGHCIHVDRCDFRHDPARKWQECGWVARRSHLTLDQGLDRFGDIFHDAQLDEVGKDREDDYKTSEKKAQVWEIWSRTENKVIWVTEGVDTTLDEEPPLIDVKGFFPCPKPAYGTVERGTLKPVPDFLFYRDQLDEINELTSRISSLAESLRLKGFYASGSSEVGEAIEAAMAQTDNKAILVPVSSVAALGASLKDAVIWLPVADVAQVIVSCVDLRRQLIEDVYEVTGLSDIMRGATDPRETKGAQDLKAQYGSIRVRERQNEMVRIALDVLRIKGEIYAENAPIQDLMLMAGMEIPSAMQIKQAQAQAQLAARQDPKAAKQIMEPFEGAVALEEIDALLKNQRLRPFAMEIETDSTIAPNEQAEKESRIEFITAIGGFIQQAGAMVAQQPETAPFAAELMKFAAGGFRAGRDLGGAIDEFADTVKAKAAQAAEGPTPEQMAAQAEIQAKQAEVQIKKSELQLKAQEMQSAQVLAQLEAQTRRMEAQSRATIGMVQAQLKAQEVNIKEDDLGLKAAQAELDAAFKMEEIDIEREQQRAVKVGDA